MPEVVIENPIDLTIQTCSFQPCTEEHVTKCRKCQRVFCVIHANHFSPNFCQDCFKNLSAVEEKFNRVFEDYDTKTEIVTIRKDIRTRYYMDGMDWPFLGVWIKNLTDEELRSWWIFHFSVMKLIEVENETRRVTKRNVQKQQTPHLISKMNVMSNGTKVKVTKAPDTADQVRAKLRKTGIPENLIDQMISAMNL